MSTTLLPPGLRRPIGALALCLAAGATAVVVTSATAATAGTGVPTDPNAVGSLTLYDASGAAVTSGSLDDPLPAYAVGSQALRDGDTRAALFAYVAAPDTPAGAWTGSQLTATTAYPATGAPASLPAGPTASSAVDSITLGDFVGDHPSQRSSANYELRVRSTAPGRAATDAYDAVDLTVSGNRWTVGSAVATSTALSVTPAGGKAGSSLTLTATITPTDVPDGLAGTVQFADGATPLGAPLAVTSSGVVTKAVTPTKAGAHSYSATFTPSSSSVGGSTGSTSYTVAKATPKLAVTWPGVRYGTKPSVKVAVTAAVPVSGTVTATYGRTTLARGTLSAGKATLTIGATALPAGSRTVTVTYGGSSDVAGASASKALAVAKAASRVTASLSPAKVSRSKRAVVTVHVTATGTTPTGTVAIYDGTKKLGQGTLAKGTLKYTLPRLTKVGKHSIKAAYVGSANVAGASAVVTLVVTS